METCYNIYRKPSKYHNANLLANKKGCAIMNPEYRELTNTVNVLQYFTPGLGLIQVNFDKFNNPSVKGLDGAPYFVGIPDEKDFLAEIREKYPNGFHSRNDVSIDWLRERVNELAKAGNIKITTLEEYGSIMVEDVNHDAYKVTIEHEHIHSPIYIAMCIARTEFIVFRPYALIEEFGPTENLQLFSPETDPIYVEPEKVMYFMDEIVSYKKYVYEFNSDNLKRVSYGFKNNKNGFMYDTRFGNFLIGGGVTYKK